MGKIGIGLLVIALLAAPAASQSKEEIYDQLVSLGNQVEATKASLDAAELEDLIAQYRALSDLLGGDDPGGLGVPAPRKALPLKVVPPPPPGGVFTTNTFSNVTPEAITDNMTSTSTIDVSGVGTFAGDIDLTVDITHTFASDLEISLTSPLGTTAVITTDNGGGNDDVFSGTLFDDQANDPVTDHAFTNMVTATPLTVEEALSVFIGEDTNGTWTLTIFDDAGGDTGTLNSWSLDVSTLDPPILSGPLLFTENTPVAITDNMTSISTLAVSGIDTYTCDIDLITDITHTFASDLEISLTSPLGTTAVITTDNGGGNDDVFSGTEWDDSANDPVTDHAFTNMVTATPLTVEEALGVFIGEDSNGTWTLTIFDDAGGDTGTLNSWSLEVNTCVGQIIEPPPDSIDIPTLGGAGLALMVGLIASGAVLMMRRRRRP